MQYKKNILTFSELGKYLLNPANTEIIQSLCITARNENAWFTEDNVKLALQNIASNFLDKDKLESFMANYSIATHAKKIGLVLAGNVPAVGFHDILCVVLSGHQALIKLSSTDSVTLRFLINKLYELDPNLKNQIIIADRLNEVDALIATGSDNTAKHFDYYFSKRPRIIRRNRTSVAVLDGNEQRSELANLGNDIFQYFGLGCRNVSKIYVPENYEFDKFFESIEYWSTIQLHHKYNNNYDYNKSIYLINIVKHFDNGFLLLKEDQALVSPISVCYYETYDSPAVLASKLDTDKDKIQCVISNNGKYKNSYKFGEAQSPQLSAFADGVDTMRFLMAL